MAIKTRFAKTTHPTRKEAEKAFTAQKGVKVDDWAFTESYKSWIFVKGDKRDSDEDDRITERDADVPGTKDPQRDSAADAGGEGKEPQGGAEDDKLKLKGEEPKFGAHVLADLHRHHTGLHEYAKTMLDHPSMEHDGVKKILEEHAEHGEEMAGKVAEAAKEHYPDTNFEELSKIPEDMPGKKSEDRITEPDPGQEPVTADELDDDDDETEEDDEEEPFEGGNKRLKTKQNPDLGEREVTDAHLEHIKEVHEFLSELGMHEQVPALFKSGCKYHCANLQKMMDENTGHGPYQPGANRQDYPDRRPDEKGLVEVLQKSLKVFA